MAHALQYRQFDFYAKTLHHRELVDRYLAGKAIAPINVEIDLTNGCNHRCSFCQWADYIGANRVSLPADLVRRTLDELKSFGTKAITWTGGGEPTLHKSFHELIGYSHTIGIENGLLTNGSRIDPAHDDELLDWMKFIRVSMAGGDRESYRAVQGRDDFERVLANLARLVSARRARGGGADIGVAFLVNRENIRSLQPFAVRLADIGVDYLQVREDMFDDADAQAWWRDEVVMRAREAEAHTVDRGLRILGAAYHEAQQSLDYPRICHAHHFVTAITADGNVRFCKNTRDKPEFAIGNLHRQGFTEIWRGSATARALEARITPRSCATFCKNM